ncbi:hypothetical protein [Nocardioides pyridinolyticus]
MRALVMTVGMTVALTGCGSPDEPEPTAADAAGVGWSPCDGLTAQEVGRIAGQTVKENNGTEDAPRCVFLPVEKGGPAYDVSYLYFDGGLDSALDAMGTVAEQLESVDVPGAEAARIAVKERRDGILVTGFVQTDGLVQSVNAVQLEGFDRDRLVTSTTALLAELAAEAPRG